VIASAPFRLVDALKRAERRFAIVNAPFTRIVAEPGLDFGPAEFWLGIFIRLPPVVLIL
jgi:hypothetical protein